MKLKYIIIILLLITTLPVVLYTLYEFSSLNDSEKIIGDIYEQEMYTLLSTINQNTTTLLKNWTEKINEITRSKDNIESNIREYFVGEDAVEAIFLTDSLLNDIDFIYVKEEKIYSDSNVLYNSLNANIKKAQRLLYRKSIGYIKPESFIFIPDSSEEKYTVILTIPESLKQITSIFGIVIDVKKLTFFSSIPLNRYTNTEVELGIFSETDSTTIYATNNLRQEDVKITSKIWLLDDYYMGIRLRGWAPEKRAQERFRRGVKMFLLLYVFLAAGVIIIYRNLKKEMAFSRMKSDFVSNVSHELRTPLSLIRMFAETLSMGRIKTEKKKHEYYDIITGETERLSHLVNNILDFSKMESGRKKFQFVGFDINQIIEKTLNTYKFHLENNGFKYSFDKSNETLIIKGDEQSIGESFINILDNAIKYSKDVKEITIRTGASRKTVWFEVEDRGIGISTIDQKHVFEKFFRVSTGLVHDVKGSGLGLALVDYIVKSHNGEIEISGKLGAGSKFRLIFPREIKTDHN